MIRLCSSLLAIVTASPYLAVAPLPELLQSVQPHEIAAAQSENADYLTEHLPYSKRHRFVKFDSEVLRTADQFTIVLFDDVKVTVKTISRKITPTGMSWYGEIIDPVWPLDGYRDASGEKLSESDAQQSHADLFGLRFTVLSWDLNQQTGKATPAYERTPSTRSVRPSEQPDMVFNAFESIFGVIRVPTIRKEFMLNSLANSLGTHVIVETDRKKILDYEKGVGSPDTND